MSMTSPIEQAKSIARILLLNNQTPSENDIRGAVKTALSAVPGVDEEALIGELEGLYNVWVASATTLDDQRGHQPWLAERQDHIDWKFWKRYRLYLEAKKGIEPAVIQRLDEVTDGILSRFEDPQRKGPWDRRGMVVGQVQSGKTQNYTGLICKAIDSGYRLIIVLAGVHNNLRSQTQVRLDEGVIGFDTQQRRTFDQRNTRIGVGLLDPTPVANSLTSSADNGDLNLRVASQLNIRIDGADPGSPSREEEHDCTEKSHEMGAFL